MSGLNDLPLFSYPDRAGHKRPGPSKEAADAIEASGRAATLRSAVLALFQSGFTATADQAASLLGEDRLAIRPRVSELVTQGALIDTGLREKNLSGRPATVWKLAPPSLTPFVEEDW